MVSGFFTVGRDKCKITAMTRSEVPLEDAAATVNSIIDQRVGQVGSDSRLCA